MPAKPGFDSRPRYLRKEKTDVVGGCAMTRFSEISWLAHVQTAARIHTQELLAKANVVSVEAGCMEEGGVRIPEIGVLVGVTRKKPIHELAPEDLVPTRLPYSSLEHGAILIVTDVVEVAS